VVQDVAKSVANAAPTNAVHARCGSLTPDISETPTCELHPIIGRWK
jgi:hypothetical protein